MIKICGYEYGTVADVAEAFGVKPKTVYTWISLGKLPRGGKSPLGMVWRMDKLAAMLDKMQASDKVYKACAENCAN